MPAPDVRGDIEIVLFDLGGVLIDFAGVEPMKALAGIETDGELWQRWLTCRWVREFERGQCDADAFGAGVVDDWNLTIAPSAFLAEFASWPRGPFPGADALLRDVRTVMPAACLSNTNVVHWEQEFSKWPILDGFDHRFLSFELGVLKPDREVFELVAERLPAPRERVLFLDDNALNVDAARDAGFAAALVRGVDESRAALVAAGVISR